MRGLSHVLAREPNGERRMKRRTWAGVIAFFLVVVFTVVAAREPVPFVTFAPGPTVNVLGKFDGKPIIEVSGRETYLDKGGLRLVTVVPSGAERKVSLAELVSAWVDPNRAVYPYEAIYQPKDTRASVRRESSVQMVSSQDNAVAAALGALGVKYQTAVKIAEVEDGGPAAGKLEVGDLVLAVDGDKVRTLEQLTAKIRPQPVGSDLTLQVRRDGKVLQEELTTTGSPTDAKASAIKVQIAPSYEFPINVDLNISENIGGPSGGLMFALGIYDVLTPGSLTGGKTIAGTGEIDAAGTVGEIGGIQQKLVGAQDDGAKLFLVPAANCADALDGNSDPDKMRLVKVTNLSDAITEVQAWVKDPNAELTRCTR
ncbi:MAG: PDZ domain-containing protein [Marmoricola sp.]